MSGEEADRVGSPMPDGLKVPDLIITRRTRTHSMSGRIEDHVQEGTVKFFCRSRGHGFIDPKKEVSQYQACFSGVQGRQECTSLSPPLPQDCHPYFMHISDIEGEYIPRKGDKVRFRLCPMPPKFDKFQAVHIQIIDFTPEVSGSCCCRCCCCRDYA